MEALWRRNYLIECKMVLKISIKLWKFKGNDAGRIMSRPYNNYKMGASVFPWNRKAANRFFKKALSSNHNQIPREITVDKNPAYPLAIDELKNDKILIKT